MSRLGAVFGRKSKGGIKDRAGEPTLEPHARMPEHVGDVLRECREHYGEDLEGVAQALRIRINYLKAIEDGRFGDLPGPTYVQGFVRAYGEYLGLDTDALLQRFGGDLPRPRARPEMGFISPLPESRFPTAAVLFLSLILAGGAAAAWYYFEAPARSGALAPGRADPAPTQPARVSLPPTPTPAPAPLVEPARDRPAQTLLPEAAVTPPVIAAPPLDGPKPAEPARAAPAPPPAPAVAALPPAAPVGDIPLAPAVEPAPDERRVYGQTNQDSRIVIGATADAWLQVRDETRSDVFTRMLRAGDSYRVPNRAGLIMLTGNAGGLEITVDGVKAPPLGPVGQVTRDIPLDPELLKRGLAAPR